MEKKNKFPAWKSFTSNVHTGPYASRHTNQTAREYSDSFSPNNGPICCRASAKIADVRRRHVRDVTLSPRVDAPCPQIVPVLIRLWTELSRAHPVTITVSRLLLIVSFQFIIRSRDGPTAVDCQIRREGNGQPWSDDGLTFFGATSAQTKLDWAIVLGPRDV